MHGNKPRDAPAAVRRSAACVRKQKHVGPVILLNRQRLEAEET